MILFDNSNFTDNEVNYLNFDSNFNIDINNSKIKVILGSNGIGKTSIYRDIQVRHSNFSYIDYNIVEDAIIKQKNILTIASRITTIDKLNSEIQSIQDKADIKKNIEGTFGLKSISKCNEVSSTLNEYRNNPINAFNKFNGNKLNVLFNLDEDLKNMFDKYNKKFLDLNEADIKLEEIKNSYRKKFLNIINNYLDSDELICPVCGNKCDEPVKNIINKIMNDITESTNEIVNDYISNNPDVKPDIVLEKIMSLKKIIKENEINLEILENYIICGGSEEKSNYIIENKAKLFQLYDERNNLENDKIEFYNSIKEIELNIREVFEKQLGIPSSNINFSEEDKELRIKLDRDISTYSTGEINLITFIVSLLEFMNSDKDTLIIDDPLSSYDIPNQYKIMYEITSANANKKFNILIFTHNIDCINIANSQHSDLYEFEIIDRINNKLYINKLDQLGSQGFNIQFILDGINNGIDYRYKGYIELLKDKDNWGINDLKHKLFHYDESYSLEINGVVYTNEELLNIIDELDEDNIINNGVIINSANKVIYLAALRVWIEKQLYDNCNDKPNLSSKKYLGDKIKFVFDENHWTGSDSVSKKFLMSKKVMLNQNDHAKSQKEPFYFALSISTDNIIKDIIDIKNHFSGE